MAQSVEVKVPDIGGFDDVPVIEVLVAEGDAVAKDQGLVTLESDKATMEVPSPVAGTIKSLKVKVGDSVSEGKVIAVVEAAGEAAGKAAAEDRAPPAEARASSTEKTPATRAPAAKSQERTVPVPEKSGPDAPPTVACRMWPVARKASGSGRSASRSICASTASQPRFKFVP